MKVGLEGRMNVEMIFDAALKASSYIYLKDAIHNKQTQIRNVLSKRCGNCFHWMKSSCMPEKEHKQFKTCNSFICKDFVLSPISEELSKKFTIELEHLKSKIEILNESKNKSKQLP